MIDLAALDRTIDTLVSRLLAQRTAGGWWEGCLSSSALSTATAVSALSLATDDDVTPGLEWLAANQNEDGGWGDTVLNRSNISTTILCWCSFSIARAPERYWHTIERAQAWLQRNAGSMEPATLVEAILRRYGEDRTFSVPILTVMAIAGKIVWREVPQLPFELAALPHQLFGWIGLPVVSYALPALIAMGQVRHHHRPPANPLLRAIRNGARAGTLNLLRSIQPSTGGYLEATPLTSFVTMSLASAGLRNHAVVTEAVRFLRDSMRDDGSWPIDTNLATWVTTLSVNALGGNHLDSGAQRAIREWLLVQQHREEHPYTHAAPGGWAWTPLPGGVPDADDTPGALLALRRLGPIDDDVRNAAHNGVRWLLDLQNRDGGMPTFCKGWGKLPFDRSGADLTAHAVAAWHAWLPDLSEPLRSRTQRAITRALGYLERTQAGDGSWTPLWFGNEHNSTEENPTYGTARTLIALRTFDMPLKAKGLRWLERSQNGDGGWGGNIGTPSSIEETALAIEALSVNGGSASLDGGVRWLTRTTECGSKTPASPIGLYFARLWYFEELYPLIFATGALIEARSVLQAASEA